MKLTNELAFAVLLACAASACAVSVETEESGSSQAALGAPANAPVINIDTLAKLQAMKNNLSGNYKLTADIDGSVSGTGNPFEPIGSSLSAFRGTFDGNGKVIKKLKINKPSDTYVGMFGYTDSALIKNVAMTDVNVTGMKYVGGLVGFGVRTHFFDSYVRGTVTGPATASSGSAIGMFAGGFGVKSQVYRCFATGTLTGAAERFGGFVGSSAGPGSYSETNDPRVWLQEVFTNVYVNPTIPSSSSTVVAGGVVGTAKGTIMQYINSIGTTKGSKRVGSIVGELLSDASGFEANQINQGIGRGTVSANITTNRAGTIGYNSGTCGRCITFWDSTVDTGTPISNTEPYQAGATSDALKSPWDLPWYYGIYILGSLMSNGDGSDGHWDSTAWSYGTNAQFQRLANIPLATDDSVQPR